jgi:hypothetical protein
MVPQSVHMHRHAVVCSTPMTQQIPAAFAFAQEEASGWSARDKVALTEVQHRAGTNADCALTKPESCHGSLASPRDFFS